MIPYDEPIVGFLGEKVNIRGYTDLHTTFGERDLTKTIPIRYLVVDVSMLYNILLEWPLLNLFDATVSISHLAMKLPSHQAISSRSMETKRQYLSSTLQG